MFISQQNNLLPSAFSPSFTEIKLKCQAHMIWNMSMNSNTSNTCIDFPSLQNKVGQEQLNRSITLKAI